MATTPRTQATAFPTFPQQVIDADSLSDEQLMGYALKTLPQVVRGLLKPYDGELFWIDNNAYIPWNESAARLNAVFGFMGWDTQEIKREYIKRNTLVWDKDRGERVAAEEDGVEVVIRLTVRAMMPEGTILTKSLENVGFAKIQTFANAMDTAVKAARSDALSRVCKLLGDAFGLFLYEKADEQQQSGGYQPRAQQQQQAPRQLQSNGYQPRQEASQGDAPAKPTFRGNADPNKPASEAQRKWLRDLKVDPALAGHADLKGVNASNAIKAIREQGIHPSQVADILKVSAPEAAAVGDLPW